MEDIEEIQKEYFRRGFDAGKEVINKIRQYFADYREAEGCSCCRDRDKHEEAEKKLAELLKPEPYSDGSGWRWDLYVTSNNNG
jgi:hypothetical protein